MKNIKKSEPKKSARILVVDDDVSIRNLARIVLEDAGYDVDATDTVSSAQQQLTVQEYDILITDIALPDASGLELLKTIHESMPDVPVILMTGYPTVETASEAIRTGSTIDYLIKPYTTGDILRTVERAATIKSIRDENRRLTHENQRYRRHLEELVQEKSAALINAYDEISRSYDFTLEALVALLDARERSTGEHSKRVREFALILAHEMELSPKEIEDISYGTLLHDIGKIAIPDAILLKPGKLTEDEWTVMRTHAQIGSDILRSRKRLVGAAEIILSHHEKYDGTGYPRGKKGEEICLGARIFAVVDAYDAMRSVRVYKDSISEELALEEMLRCNGAHFDPAVVRVFLECRPALEEIAIWDELPSPAL